MSQPLNLLLMGCPEVVPILKDDFRKIYGVETPKQLIRGLMDRKVDLIVIDEGRLAIEKIRKIFKTYSCPVFILQKSAKKETDEYGIYFVKIKQLAAKFLELNFEIRNMKFRRRNTELLDLLDAVRGFEETVKDIEKDLFVPQVNQFFEDRLNARECYWIGMKDPNQNLPPILQCKDGLLKQKVNHLKVLGDLDACEVEMISEPGFQVWKQRKGSYLALVWVEVSKGHSQCILLNDLKFFSIQELKNLLDYIVPVLSRRWELCRIVEHAQVEVFQDSLTNLYNQRYLAQILKQKIHEEQRYKTPFTILFIDVDHFKKVNDSKGHVVGSAVLVALGGLLGECIRNTDYAFRYGGDEFIILLGHTEGEQAEIVAERIRYKVEQEKFSVRDENVNITVSIGLASYPKHASSAEEIIQIADEAMYYGKNKSRNIVYKAS